MIDKVSMMQGHASVLNRQSADINSTGLSNPTGATALRQRLLERADASFSPARQDVEFPQRMTDALHSVAEAQNDSARITRDFELGRETDLAKVMVTQQVSSLGFQMALNVRNKVLSAYKDIMNMPV